MNYDLKSDTYEVGDQRWKVRRSRFLNGGAIASTALDNGIEVRYETLTGTGGYLFVGKVRVAMLNSDGSILKIDGRSFIDFAEESRLRTIIAAGREAISAAVRAQDADEVPARRRAEEKARANRVKAARQAEEALAKLPR